MSARPKFPPLAEVVALAEQTDLDVSAVDLARMYKQGVFSQHVVSVLWPKVTARQAAFLVGHKQYVGAPCKCGRTLRHVASRTCVPCHRERKRGYKNTSNWHAENREYLRLYLKAWRAKRKEQAA